MTFPGAPCVYYGDEIGLEGGHDPGCRAGFPWAGESEWNLDILDATRSLIRLRHDQPALRHGAYRSLVAERASLVYAFERAFEGNRIVVVANAGPEPAAVSIPWVDDSGEPSPLWGSGYLRAEGGVLRGEVPARSGAVWGVG
jgi:glycosidase